MPGIVPEWKFFVWYAMLCFTLSCVFRKKKKDQRRSFRHGIHICLSYRAIFKWLSKVITWLRLARLMIGFKASRQFFSRWEAKPKPIAPGARDFSRPLSKLQIIARNFDWFMALYAPVVIGRSIIALVLVFRQSFENRSISTIVP